MEIVDEQLLEQARANQRDPFMLAQRIAYHSREIERAAYVARSVPGTGQTARSVPGGWPEQGEIVRSAAL